MCALRVTLVFSGLRTKGIWHMGTQGMKVEEGNHEDPCGAPF